MVEPELLAGIQRNPQVAVVNRVECPTEDADRAAIGFFGGTRAGGRGPRAG